MKNTDKIVALLERLVALQEASAPAPDGPLAPVPPPPASTLQTSRSASMWRVGTTVVGYSGSAGRAIFVVVDQMDNGHRRKLWRQVSPAYGDNFTGGAFPELASVQWLIHQPTKRDLLPVTDLVD